MAILTLGHGVHRAIRGRTVGEHTRPEIARAYELGGTPASLLALPSGGAA